MLYLVFFSFYSTTKNSTEQGHYTETNYCTVKGKPEHHGSCEDINNSSQERIFQTVLLNLLCNECESNTGHLPHSYIHRSDIVIEGIQASTLTFPTQPCCWLPFDLYTAVVTVVVAFDTVDHFAKIWPFTVFAGTLCLQGRVMSSCQ